MNKPHKDCCILQSSGETGFKLPMNTASQVHGFQTFTKRSSYKITPRGLLRLPRPSSRPISNVAEQAHDLNQKNLETCITDFSLKLDPPQSSLRPWHGHRRRSASIGAEPLNLRYKCSLERLGGESRSPIRRKAQCPQTPRAPPRVSTRPPPQMLSREPRGRV